MKAKYWFLSSRYVAGLLTGLGLGVIITNALVASPEHRVVVAPWAYIGGWLCLGIGGVLGRAAHRAAQNI